MGAQSRILLRIGIVCTFLIWNGHRDACAQNASDIMPARVKEIFESRCLSCHNDLDQKGDFSLQSRGAAFRDGYIVQKQANNSHLLSVLMPDGGHPPAMPKDSEPLSAADVEVIKDWIVTGSAWPEELTLTEPAVSDFDWWSFRPIVRPVVPEQSAEDGQNFEIRSPIDAFVRQKQLERNLHASEAADRFTLIRRLTYDLTGLPPTPREISEFVSADGKDAYERLVERLLASPHYGERWGRHWLDVVKYADTCGYDKDKLRPNAWPYRDYVVRSFNADKPYARFVQEQIAGDVLFPGEPDGILGLGFIAAGPWDFIGHVEVPESKIDGKVARNLDRDDMVSNTLNTFCSITIQCARCHNHKFDPFTQEHYYSLQSVFAAVDRAERIYNTDPAVEQQRLEFTATRTARQASIKVFDKGVREQGGDVLADLEAEIAALTVKVQPQTRASEFGYHSVIEKSANVAKWVTVDLGREVPISKVVLHPCHDDYAGIGAGFGFPVRFRVEARSVDDFSEQGSADNLSAADDMKTDFENPGLAPVEIPLSSGSARYVRITATKLAERKNDFNFALAEVEVFNVNGQNVAANGAVTAKDSIEAPVRWRKINLTDGLWPQAADSAAAERLLEAKIRRTEILTGILTPAKKAERIVLVRQRDEVNKKLASLPQGNMVYAAATHFPPQGNFKPTNGIPRTVSVLHRGNIQQPTKEASPGRVPLSENDVWQLKLSDDHSEADRRAVLAQWLTDSQHPLTWRSIANRIWQYHFGMGLVGSPNDFGRMGQIPTHPELLDWLADEFRTTQSFKHLHRLIVHSSTYRQRSDFDPNSAKIDSDNQFLWRMNRRRLSAEEIRDSVLAVSGCLDRTPGGPGFYLFELEKPQHSPHFEYHKFDPADKASHRRSIYRFIVRSQPDPLMTTLDCADSSQSTPLRTETLTSLQALSLFNNKFTLTMARRFAERVVVENVECGNAARAFQLTTGRLPEASETQALETYSQLHGLPNLCRVLLNASEFVFVD